MKDLLLNREISYEEAEKCINEMNDAAPGPNGLTIGFYKKYFKYFGNHFIDILNNLEGRLTETFNIVRLKLIPKNNNILKSIDDLRPISLTNYEYRIYTRILSNRLQRISDKLIGENQSCSILGRRMNDNLFLTRDLIYDSKIRNKILNIVSVDQRKAFDTISHKYLFNLLKHINLGNYMCTSIERLYKNSFAYVSINNFKSENFKVNSGIKQGCALSMLLYVIAIEELILRIDLNPNIKGYKINIFNQIEIKTSAYADDVCGYTSDELSIGKFFKEFTEWGRISGASINKNKTKILSLNNSNSSNYDDKRVSELKILGVIFDSNGVSKINLDIIKSKIINSTLIWSRVNINMIERIVACKTFILNKLWFIANLTFINEKFLRDINKIIHNFIWNNSIELVKRNLMILPLEKGGLDMFNLKAKLETIYFQNFIYISRQYQRVCYNLSVYWLKFFLKELNLKNFNIIPTGQDDKRPKEYSFMIECLKKYKNLNKSFKLGKSILKSKIVYETYRTEYEGKPNSELKILKLDRKSVYKKLLSKKLDSNLIVNNFKILNNALALNIKYCNRIKNKCFLCKGQIEDLDHLFIGCSTTLEFFRQIKPLYFGEDVTLNKFNIYFSESLNHQESKLFSIFKLCIWKLRNIARMQSIIDKNNFKNYFLYNLEKYS